MIRCYILVTNVDAFHWSTFTFVQQIMKRGYFLLVIIMCAQLSRCYRPHASAVSWASISTGWPWTKFSPQLLKNFYPSHTRTFPGKLLFNIFSASSFSQNYSFFYPVNSSTWAVLCSHLLLSQQANSSLSSSPSSSLPCDFFSCLLFSNRISFDIFYRPYFFSRTSPSSLKFVFVRVSFGDTFLHSRFIACCSCTTVVVLALAGVLVLAAGVLALAAGVLALAAIVLVLAASVLKVD